MAVDQITWGRLSLYSLSTADDARRSSITGTTLSGPNGSGQFNWVYTSTTKDFQARLASTLFAQSTLVQVIGILQNTPGPGEACDIGYVGVSKVIAGSTSITNGTLLQQASTLAGIASGQVMPWQTGSGPPIGYALETPTSSGAVFSAMINVTAQRST
jgi:hypothetical protein